MQTTGGRPSMAPTAAYKPAMDLKRCMVEDSRGRAKQSTEHDRGGEREGWGGGTASKMKKKRRILQSSQQD